MWLSGNTKKAGPFLLYKKKYKNCSCIVVREQTEQSLFSSGVFTWGGKDQTLEILSRPIKNPLIIKKKGQKKGKTPKQNKNCFMFEIQRSVRK